MIFSQKGTKILIEALLKNENLGKLFIEPHLKQRLSLNESRVRHHLYRAVKYNDHIHIKIEKL